MCLQTLQTAERSGRWLNHQPKWSPELLMKTYRGWRNCGNVCTVCLWDRVLWRLKLNWEFQLKFCVRFEVANRIHNCNSIWMQLGRITMNWNSKIFTRQVMCNLKSLSRKPLNADLKSLTWKFWRFKRYPREDKPFGEWLAGHMLAIARQIYFLSIKI